MSRISKTFVGTNGRFPSSFPFKNVRPTLYLWPPLERLCCRGALVRVDTVVLAAGLTSRDVFTKLLLRRRYMWRLLRRPSTPLEVIWTATAHRCCIGAIAMTLHQMTLQLRHWHCRARLQLLYPHARSWDDGWFGWFTLQFDRRRPDHTVLRNSRTIFPRASLSWTSLPICCWLVLAHG